MRRARWRNVLGIRSKHSPLWRGEGPAGDGVDEILGVLVLAEGNLGLNSKDAAVGGFKHWSNVSAVLAVVHFDDLLPDSPILDVFCDAFEDHRFIGLFRTDHAVRIRCDVLRLAGAQPSAEPEGVLPPDAPDEHEMRSSVRA
jgi:hypothetical protein